jgi:hypothetical protein
MNNLSTNTDEKKCEYCGTNKTYITVTKNRAPHPKWNNYPFKEDIWICGKCYRSLLYHKALLPSHVRKGLRKARIVRRICHKCGGKIENVTATANTNLPQQGDTQTLSVKTQPNTTGTGQPFSIRTEEARPAQGNQPGQVGAQTREQEQEPEVKPPKKEESNDELKAQVSKLTETVTKLLEERDAEKKTATERRTAEKRQLIESAFPENYANSPEERTKAIENLMKFDGPELDYIMEKFVVPVTGVDNTPCGQEGGVRQAGAGSGGCADRDKGNNTNPITKRRLSRLTDYAKPNVPDKGKVSQAGISGDSNTIDDERYRRILSMTNIVNSSRLSGAWR